MIVVKVVGREIRVASREIIQLQENEIESQTKDLNNDLNIQSIVVITYGHCKVCVCFAF